MSEPERAGFLVRTTADKKNIFLQAIATNHHDLQDVIDTFMFQYVKETLEATMDNGTEYPEFDYEGALNEIRALWRKRHHEDVFSAL